MSEAKPPSQKSESDATVEMTKRIPDGTPPAQMTAPAPGGSQMVARTPKVKIKAIRDINISEEPGEMKVLKPGEIGEVTQAQAVEFCDRKFRGNYPYSGERYEDTQPAAIVRAVRV